MNTLIFVLWNIQILLESLPVSSSAHIKLIYERFCTKSIGIALSNNLEIMHIPTMFVINGALAFYYFTTYTVSLLLNCESLFSLIIAVIIADLVTGIAYIARALFSKFYPTYHFPAALGLCISGIMLLSLIGYPESSFCHECCGSVIISPQQALIIGLAQAAALLPGISRLAVTIVTATWLGMHPVIGALFSIIIELPLIAASAGKALIQDPQSLFLLFRLSAPQAIILILTSLVSCLLLIGIITMCEFYPDMLSLFGLYLIALSVYCLLRHSKKKA